MNAEREQRTVFGEVAQLYDEARPSYPDEIFEMIVEYGALEAGDRILEVGAGTGKATEKWLARGFDVLALEPSAPMADVLRPKGARIEVTTFEAWNGDEGKPFRLVTAAQAWHWVHGPDRYERAAQALEPSGAIALFWNKPRNFEGDLRRDMDVAYTAHSTGSAEGSMPPWKLDATFDELAVSSAFEAAVKREVTWQRTYTTDEYMRLHQTHSDHRIMPEPNRTRLHDDLRAVIDAHGGRVEVVYDTQLYLARRR